MKQKIGFQFMGNDYFDYRSLTVAMAKNWTDAVGIIDKEQFLDYFAKNDQLMYGRLELEIKRCSYVETACSMALYSLYPNDGVCIGGRFFKSLKDLAKCMYQNYPNIVPSIIHFFKDKCVSHVFTAFNAANLPDREKNFLKDIKFIEENIETPFIYSYFMKFFFDDLDSKVNDGFTILDKFFRVTLSNQKESVKMVHELSKNPDFLVVLARYYGIKRIFAYTNEPDYFFNGLKLVKKYVTFDLRELLDSGYHIWLATHYQFYDFETKNAKKLLKEYKAISKDKEFFVKDDYDKYFDNMHTLYDMYLKFVQQYADGEISTINETYFVHNAYNDTVVPAQYFTDMGIETTLEVIELNELRDKSVETPTFGLDSGNKRQAKEIIHRQPKKFRVTLINRLIFALLMMLTGLGLAGFDIFKLFIDKKPLVDDFYDYAIIGIGALLFIIALVVLVKSIKALGKLNFYFPKKDALDFQEDNISVSQKMEEASVQPEKEETDELYEIENFDSPIAADFSAEEKASYTETKLRFKDLPKDEQEIITNKIYFRYEFVGTLIYTFFAYLAACYFYGLGLDALDGNSNDLIAKTIAEFAEVYVVICPVVVFILSFFKKRKGFFAMLLFTIIGLVVMTLVPFIISLF